LVDIDIISISRNASKVRRADGGLDLAHFYEDKVKDITGDKMRVTQMQNLQVSFLLLLAFRRDSENNHSVEQVNLCDFHNNLVSPP